MAKSKKYKFVKDHSDARIVIPGYPEITKDTITDEQGDLILKSYPQLVHNIELVEKEEEKEAVQSKNKKAEKDTE